MTAWLASARRAPTLVGVFVDFDGTLAPIVSDPAAASPHPDAAGLLRRLSERWGRVVVVSGRPVAYLRSHLAQAGGTELYGLYGLEQAPASSSESGTITRPEGEVWRAAVDDAASIAGRDAPAGVHVEHKGLTVTLHYRNAPGGEAWVRRFSADVSARTGLAAHGGKMSIELRPPVEVDKGTVIRDLAGGMHAVLFAGDDLGDLPAFAELRRLRESGVATLGVASGGHETPAPVLDAADIVVDGPAGVVHLLEALLED